MQPKRTMSSTGLKRRWSTESHSVLPDGSKRPYTSERKDNRPWTVMRAATNWATHTTAFLTRRLPVVSRTRRTEHQFLLMKASDRGRNVKFLGNNFGCVLSKWSNSKQCFCHNNRMLCGVKTYNKCSKCSLLALTQSFLPLLYCAVNKEVSHHLCWFKCFKSLLSLWKPRNWF